MSNLKPLQCLNLDKSQQKLFIRYYKSLGEKPATTIRIFDRSEYYSCHGEDAWFAAKCLFKSTNVVKIMEVTGDSGDDDDDQDMEESGVNGGEKATGTKELPYVVLSKNNFENFVRDLLLVRHYRVEVYTNKSSKKASGEWTLEFKGSPGNLSQFEDVLFNHNEMVTGSALISMHIKQEDKRRVVGIGYVELNQRQLSVAEFVDDDFFTELEALVVILNPKECLLPSTTAEYERVQQLMNRNNVATTVRKKQEFSLAKSDVIDNLNKLLRFAKGQQANANTLPETSKTHALAALGATITYLGLCEDDTNDGNFSLNLLNTKRYVHLDTAAVSALNLFPKPGIPRNANAFRWHSVLGVLDRCRTPQGHRLMGQWIRQPLRNIDAIKDRHDIVECFVNDTTVRAELYDNHMKKLPDVLLILRRLYRKKASLQDIFRLYQVTLRLAKILQTLGMLESTAVRSVLFQPIKDAVGDLKLFKSMVEQIMDLEAVERGEYLVKHTFDEELREKRSEMDVIDAKMKKHLSRVADDIGLEKDSGIKLEFVSHHGYHFRILVKDETLIRKNSEYRVLDAVKGGVRFTTEKLSDCSAEFASLKEAYEEQQKTIVDEVVRIATGYAEPWTILSNLTAQLDCFLSFAVAAVNAPEGYIRPVMHAEGGGVLKFRNLRHPCLELQEDVNFIANDVEFDRQETTMYIITGPNMGGKSTFIRSVGVGVLMAHIGSFVPAEEAHITVVDSILGRVGADDNLSKGLSTFMVEMIETAGILRAASANSLVIIDELGRGTSTYEGCGIAWSIAESLGKDTKCFTLFATHFHEITELSKTVPTVKNYHMAAMTSDENLTLLYQIKPGVTEKSFGIQVAKMANFPASVIQQANQFYDEFEDHYTQILRENNPATLATFSECMREIEKLDDMDMGEFCKTIEHIRKAIEGTGSEYFRSIMANANGQ